MGNITIQGDLTGDVPGGEVGGASNLTTVGAIPYVSAAGTLNQDPTALFWDAANNRLGVGTASPAQALQVVGSIQLGGSSAFNNRVDFVSDSRSISWSLRGGGAALPGTLELYDNTAAASRIAVATTGNVMIATPTDSNFKLDVAASGSAGTARFYGGAGVSNSTKVVVRAGAGQSGNLQEWQDSAGAVLASVNDYGYIRSTFFQANDTAYLASGFLTLQSAGRVRWTNDTSAGAATIDLSLSRASAGVLQVGDGGANANGYLSAARIGVGTASPSTALHVASSTTDVAITLDSSGSGDSIWKTDSSGVTSFGTTNNSAVAFLSSNTERMRVTGSTGNLLIGTPTDGNFKLDVASSGSSGTLRVYDQTATTGSTKMVVRAGAGQSGNLQEWQSSAGSVVASVVYDGTDSQGTFLGNGAYLALKSALASPYASLVFFKSSNTQTWRVGNVGSDSLQFLAGAAENSMASLTSAGTFTVYNQTPTTGVTKAVIRAGAGQGATNLTEWQNSAGTVQAYVSSIGTIRTASFMSLNDGIYLMDDGNLSTLQSSTWKIKWTNGSAGSTPDLSLSRASAGVLQVGDGGSNANGYIGFGNGAGIIGTANSLGLIYTAGQIEFRSPTASRLMTLGGTGTISVYNETPTTGSTKMVVRAGAGQSGSMEEWQNSGGSVLARISSSGDIQTIADISVSHGGFAASHVRLASTSVKMASQIPLGWVSSTNADAAFDTALYRNAAGVIEVNNGTAGTYRDIIARRHQASGETVASLPAAAAGNAGTISYVTDANATTIGSTVAGGGANKVLVWSDGTAWKIFAN